MTLREAVMLFFILVVLAAGAALISMQMFTGPSPAADSTPSPEQGPDDSVPFDSPLDLAGTSDVPLAETAIRGVQDASATWGPGVLDITGDILISPGVTITIAPGTTIRMATSDGADLGVDPSRIEYMVAGTLRVDGPVVFTSQSPYPACGDWYGIRFLPDSDGYLKEASIEWGVHAVQINTANSLYIADSTLRFNCDKPENADAWGAGLSIFAGNHHVVRTQIFGNSVETTGWSNSAIGAGVWLASGSTLFQDCSIHSNRAQSTEYDAMGGGVALWGGGVPILRKCEIRHNTVAGTNRARGGGIDIDNTNAIIEGDTFIHDNSVTAIEGGAYGGGISISTVEHPSAPVIRNSRVMTNICVAQSAIGCHGGGIGFPFAAGERGQNQAVISHNLIAGNLSQGPRAQGGGIGLERYATADRIDGNVIRGNLAQASGRGARGGGISLASDNGARIANNLFYGNEAEDLGGEFARGGGAYIKGVEAYFTNNTVVANEAGEGGGIYLANGALYNNIVASNVASIDGGGIYWIKGDAGHNNAWSNGPDDYAAEGHPRPATDINADPLFVGAGGASDLQQRSGEGMTSTDQDLASNFHLQPGSPCIDTASGSAPGLPDADFDHQPRPQGRAHDMGFDEVPRPVLSVIKAVTGEPVAGAPFTYTITVVNSSTLAPGSGIIVTDSVPVGGHWVRGGSQGQGTVTLTLPAVPPQEQVSASWVVSSCQTELTNQRYRVASSDQRVGSDWGPPQTTQLRLPGLVPRFELSRETVMVREPVTLTTNSTTDGAPIVDWAWDLGDGTIGHGPTVTHIYSATDSYTVTLTITDACRFSQTRIVANAIIVGPRPICTEVDAVDLAMVTTDKIYSGDKVQFKAEIRPRGSSELYRFRVTTDGSQGFVVTSRDNPLSFSQNFPNGGTHTLEVAIWNCKLTEKEAASDSLTVKVLPRALIYLPLLLK